MEQITGNKTDWHLKDWMSRAYQERAARNPQYSLRSFARDIELDSSHLSSVLKGKKGISPVKAEKIAQILGYSKAEAQAFVLTVTRDFSRRSGERILAKESLKTSPEVSKPDFHSLSADMYRMVSDWYVTAIFEYLRRPRADQSVPKLSKVFQISPVQVEDAFHRLERLHFIEKRGDRWKVKEGGISSPAGVPSEAIRNHHTQILKKAESALHFQSLDRREFSSIEMLIHTDRIPEMKEYLRDCWKGFCERFVDNETGNAVYEFSQQLFELGKIELKSNSESRSKK